MLKHFTSHTHLAGRTGRQASNRRSKPQIDYVIPSQRFWCSTRLSSVAGIATPTRYYSTFSLYRSLVVYSTPSTPKFYQFHWMNTYEHIKYFTYNRNILGSLLRSNSTWTNVKNYIKKLVCFDERFFYDFGAMVSA